MINIRKTKLLSLYIEGKYQEVLNTVEEIRKTNPNDIYSLFYAADSYRKLEMYDNSIEILRYILSINCMNIAAKIDLFDLLYKLNRYEEAKQLLDEILTFDCEEVKNNISYYELAKIIIEQHIDSKRRRLKLNRTKSKKHFNSSEEAESSHINLYIK